MNKNLILIIIFIFLTQCGYSPVYKADTKSKVNIILADLKGDKDFNNKLNSKLKKYYNGNSENSFTISVNSKIEKNIITKNSKGKITNYELVATATFRIIYKNVESNLILEENLKIINKDNSFEEKKYENTVKNTFASSMIERLIIKLNTL